MVDSFIWWPTGEGFQLSLLLSQRQKLGCAGSKLSKPCSEGAVEEDLHKVFKDYLGFSEDWVHSCTIGLLAGHR